MLEPIDPKEWAESVKGQRVKRTMVRSTKGVSFVTIEFGNGYAFEVITYEEKNQVIPTFWKPIAPDLDPGKMKPKEKAINSKKEEEEDIDELGG